MLSTGRTVMLVPVTCPSPGAIETVSAPVTFQERTVDPPGATVEGDAVNDRMAGRAGAISCSLPPRQPESPAARASTARPRAGRVDRDAGIIAEM